VSFWTFGSGKKLLRTIDDKKEIARSCAVWNKIYRRDLIFKNNLSFYPSKDIGDFPFMFRATTLSGKIALVRDAKMYYRQRETSIMANAKKQSKIIFDAMDNHEALLKDLEILRLSDGDKNKWREILQVFTIDNILGWSFCLKPNNKSRYFSRFAVIVRDFDMDCNRYSNKWTNLIWKSASHCNASRLLKIICKDSKIIYKFFGIPVVIITNKSGRLRFYLFGKIRFYETAVSISSSR
jgi:hypothetical protein